jgi:RNA-directed DNA polymerase
VLLRLIIASFCRCGGFSGCSDKLQTVKTELRRRMHDPVPEVGKWLKSLVGGHIRYFGVPGNRYALAYFRFAVSNLWHHVLRRRSQEGGVKWERRKRLIHRWLPPARICHPYPSRRPRVTT